MNKEELLSHIDSFDATQMPFLMYGVRELIELYPDNIHLEEQIKLIENAIIEHPSLAFDSSHSIIESICKTIQKEIGETPNSKQSLPGLLKETCRNIGLATGSNQDPQTGLVNGLTHSINKICEMRNKGGLVSHGRHEKSVNIEFAQAVFVAKSSDSICNFLYKTHRSLLEREDAILQYHEYEKFNEYLDLEGDVHKVAGIEIKLSEALFYVDKDRYIKAYKEFIEREKEGEDE